MEKGIPSYPHGKWRLLVYMSMIELFALEATNVLKALIVIACHLTSLTILCTPPFGHFLTRNGQHFHIGTLQQTHGHASNNLNFVMTNVDGWEHTVSTNIINPERHTTIQSIWQI
jgi:hypothetical protein